MKISINASSLTVFADLDKFRAHAAAAADDGFPSWWLAQGVLVDALTVFTAIADSAPDIELGTAVVPTFPRHPSMLAGQALTTQAAIGGRLTLGIGLSHKPMIEDVLGMAFERPVRHLIDYLEILNALLNEGKASYRGEVFTAVTEQMARITESPPSVMVAALGEQTLKVTGRRTDGTILWMVGERTIAGHIEPVITDAAAAADRPAPRIVCGLPVCVTDDPAPVREFADVALKVYGELPSYRAMLDREGADGPSDVALFGPADYVGERLAAIREAGATEFAAVEFGTTGEDIARTREFLKAQL